MSERITPTDHFSNSIVAGKLTKAVYVAPAGGTAFTAHCSANNQTVNFATGGQWYPIQTDVALGGAAGCTIVYAY